MAIPNFATFALFNVGTDGTAKETFGTIEPRNFTEALPNVNGEFVQPTGNSGRTISATGLINQSTLALLQASIRSLQQLANGRTVGDYIDISSVTHETCILLSFSPGPIQPLVGSFQCQCTATLRQLNPPVA